jgi:hypothetical protein
MPTERICISMILLEPAYKILHTTVKFKRRTISVAPFSIRRLFAATRVGLMLFPERSSCTNDG